MNPRLVESLGSLFAVDDVADLELLTDLLYLSGEHLNVVFAVASYLQHRPNGMSQLKPVVVQRFDNSLAQLPRYSA